MNKRGVEGIEVNSERTGLLNIRAVIGFKYRFFRVKMEE